jgi:hypothetical protein
MGDGGAAGLLSTRDQVKVLPSGLLLMASWCAAKMLTSLVRLGPGQRLNLSFQLL